MKIAITGSAGLFGQGLVQVIQRRHRVLPISRAEADITKFDEVRSVFLRLRPDVVIHSAAIPSPDVCEANPALAYLVNVHGTRYVAEAAREIGAALAYISTDAVFDGGKGHPYTESDLTLPRTVYGRTKLRGEQIVAQSPKHWIFRVPVLFGPGKTNFIEKGLRILAAGEEYVVASDQMGSATYTLDAAEKILEVVESGRSGLYHLSNQGACTRYELATHAAELAGLDAGRVAGVPLELMGRRARRLKYAVMEMQALKDAGFSLPRTWQEALADYLKTILPL
ncbi:MAG TPA: dTDP-4-dehydrorhamnose reductase [Terriglobia bacterium]|nr:dTDP-4-dehydrorhamnose reductase [Terriglobia bacterium]